MKKILLTLSFIIIADVSHFVQADHGYAVGKTYTEGGSDKDIDSGIQTPSKKEIPQICNKLCNPKEGALWDNKSKLNEKGNLVCTCQVGY